MEHRKLSLWTKKIENLEKQEEEEKRCWTNFVFDLKREVSDPEYFIFESFSLE